MSHTKTCASHDRAHRLTLTLAGLRRIFFDDEHRNIEVETKLGVHFVDVSRNGLDLAAFEHGVRGWRAKQAARTGAPREQL